MPGPSIAIAGGGLIGMSIAWRLTQAGFAVTVFDQGSIAGEASWAGAGMLAPGGELDAPSDLARLAVESRSLYRSFVRELESVAHLAIDYQECGALDLAYDDAEWEHLKLRADKQVALGIVAKELKTKQVRTFWPRVRAEGLTGALFYADDAIVNPRDLADALEAACRAAGVEILPHTPIHHAELSAGGVLVHGNRSAREFATLAIAAGAWSSSISVAGVPALPPCEPVRGHLIGFAQPDQTCNTILRHGHTYLLQRANGLLIAGASVEKVGWDRTVDPNIAALLARRAEFVLPHLAETSHAEAWIGFRPASDAIHIGPWHSERLYLAYGHYRNGILLAPVTARIIAGQITASFGMQERASA